MANKDDGGKAFPRPATWSNPGMTLRDYFAGLAMQKVGPQSAYNMRDNEPSADFVARKSYEYADAMLKERAK